MFRSARKTLESYNSWMLTPTYDKIQKIRIYYRLRSKAPVLQYYDVNKPVTLSVDASKSGLGAVLLQNGLPVEYASKALTQTEQRYAQIEKEALVIAFGCIKFDQKIYGKEIHVESDHKPLESIFKKCINDCPARLQSIRLRLQRYNLIVKYKPGKELFL